MLMFCSASSFVFRLHLLNLMFDRAFRAFLGHRFDKETPIAETVRKFLSDLDGIIS